MGRTELLAPAGDMACLKAAVNAGADAVYLGGEAYGARAYASNFTKDELCMAIRYAHLFGVKVYLTVNTLVKERELEGVCEFIAPFYEEGLDGVIVQDFGVLKLLKENFPNLPLHGSTQMCITGKYGAELLKKYGVCRVVPARELSLEEMMEIRRETGIEIEAFIHGAMCYCYSGQCLFSSFLGGRSGNRGRCAGPCRLPYSVFDQKEIYPLSLKDMCTLPMLYELLDAGIDSFKIEGRMKNPYYVAGVTDIYRKYIDLYEESRKKNTVYRVDQRDLESLCRLYVRTELETGYYHRHNGADMVTLQKPGYLSGEEKDFPWIKEQYLEKDKKVGLQCELNVCAGELLHLSVWTDDQSPDDGISVNGNTVVEKALNRPTSVEDIRKQLSKTGNTPFQFEKISVIMDEDVFIPVRELNELRRQALDAIWKKMTETSKRQSGTKVITHRETKPDCVDPERQKSEPKIDPKREPKIDPKIDRDKESYRISVTTREQLDAVLAFAGSTASGSKKRRKIAGIEVHFTMLQDPGEEWKTDIPLFLCMPQVFRKKAAEYCDHYLTDGLLRRFDGFYCATPDALAYLQMRLNRAGICDGTKEIYADYSLYTCNSEAVSFLEQQGITGFVGSYELNRYEWDELLEACGRQEDIKQPDTEFLVYGHVPFMQTAGCVKKTFGRCDKKNTVTYLKDRMGRQLPVMNFCQLCENTIYNGIPLSLDQEREQIICDHYRISFTTEDAVQTEAVLDCFILGEPQPFEEFTKGHFKKGIE